MKKIFVILALLLVGCGSKEVIIIEPTVDPGITLEEYLTIIEPIILKWEDAIDLADSTSRGNLPDRIASLQEIRREVQAIKAEGDQRIVLGQQHLINAMNEAIDGYTAFMVQDSDSEVNSHFTKYFDYLERFYERMSAAE